MRMFPAVRAGGGGGFGEKLKLKIKRKKIMEKNIWVIQEYIGG
jgi:hypothetical protein